MKRFAILLVVVTAAISFDQKAFASPLDLYGFGTRSPSMGRTGVAQNPNRNADVGSVFINPANVGGAKRTWFELGTQFGRMDLKIDGVRKDVENPSAVHFAGYLPLRMNGWAKDRFAFGIGAHIALAALSRAQHPRIGETFFELLEAKSQNVAMVIGLGAQLSDRLRVGASFMALATLEGQLDVTTDAAGRFTTFSEQRLIAKLTPIVGAQYAWKDNLTFGGVIRGVARTKYAIVVTNDLGEAIPIELPPILIAGVAQYLPATLELEAEWEPSPQLSISGQLAFQRWSAYALPTENVTETTTPQPDVNFHDTLVPKIGVEWRVQRPKVHFALRGGYVFFASPAPEMTGRHSLLDNNRHTFSLGAQFSFPTLTVPISISVWGQGQFLQNRRHTKDPLEFPAGATLPFSTIRTNGRIGIGGITLGLPI